MVMHPQRGLARWGSGRNFTRSIAVKGRYTRLPCSANSGLLGHPLLDVDRVASRTSWVMRIEQNFGPAHRAEVRGLGRLGGQRLVVELARGVRVERQRELVVPPELEPRRGQRVVALLGARMPLGQVGGVRGDLVGDHAVLDVLAVGQPEVLLRGDVAQHRGAGLGDDRRADRRGDVVVGRVRCRWPAGRACRTAPPRTAPPRAARSRRSCASGRGPGPSIITCTPWDFAILVSSPRVRSSANCAASLASAIEPGRSPSPREKVTS